jgi:hypothetical protein
MGHNFQSQGLQWKEETYPPFHLVLDAQCFKPSIVSRVLCSVEPVDDHVKFNQHFSYFLLDSFEHKMFYFVFKENKTGGRGRVVCCREEAKTQPYEWGHHQWLSCWFCWKARKGPLPHSHWLANNTPKPITNHNEKLLPKTSDSPKSQRFAHSGGSLWDECVNSSRGSTSREKKGLAKLKVTTPAQQLRRLYKICEW